LNGNPDTAADITQDVFLKLLENIQSVRKIGKFQNYLLTIAVNTCNNYTKKAKPLYMVFGSGKNSHYGPGKISQM